MKKIVILALIGLLAQMIDGSLGMAYGVTSTTLLLIVGLSPAIVSASVHLSEVVTSAVSGYSHFKFGNVDFNIVKKLVLPGAIGAFMGAAFLSYIPGSFIKPYISLFLLGLGVYVVIRFLFMKWRVGEEKNISEDKRFFYKPLGFAAGFLDASGGGGWGPLTTPILLTQRHLPPSKVIGSVNFSEFAISLSASIAFFLFIGWDTLYWQIVLAMMAGGVIAAPFAAFLVKKIKPAVLGVLAGGLIVITNLKTIAQEFFSVSLFTELRFLLPLLVIWGLLLVFAIRKKTQ